VFGLFADNGPAVSDGIRPAATLPRQEPDMRQPKADHPRIHELESEVVTLKTELKQLEEKHFTVSYEKKASEQMVTMLREQLKEDRKEFFQQMDKLMKEMGDTKQLVGELQTQLKQIAAPKSHTTSVTRPVAEAEVIDATPPMPGADTPLTASSSFRPAYADIRESNTEERV
jgi:chromosome segregation ATPase